MSEVSQVLEQLLNQLAQELKANIPNASGETANSIEVRITETTDRVRGDLLGAKYIMALEDGRGPTGSGGGKSEGKTLREKILEWIKAKNITPVNTARKMNQEQLSWAIAIKIHNEGTKLFRDGGHSGVISNVINDQRIETFIEVFQSRAARILLQNILKRANA